MKASDVFYGFFYRRLMKLAHRTNPASAGEEMRDGKIQEEADCD